MDGHSIRSKESRLLSGFYSRCTELCVESWPKLSPTNINYEQRAQRLRCHAYSMHETTPMLFTAGCA